MIDVKFVTEHRDLPANSRAAGLRDRILARYNFDLGPIIWSLAETENREDRLESWDPSTAIGEHCQLHTILSVPEGLIPCCGFTQAILYCVSADGESRGDAKTARDFSQEISRVLTTIGRARKEMNSAFDLVLRIATDAGTQNFHQCLPNIDDRSTVDASFAKLTLVLERIKSKMWKDIPTTDPEDRQIMRRRGPPKRILHTTLWKLLVGYGVTPEKLSFLLPDQTNAGATTPEQAVNAPDRVRDRARPRSKIRPRSKSRKSR
jgi:hypothetical protein